MRIYGGPDIAEVLNQVIPPHSVGHQEFDLYPTPGDGGAPARAGGCSPRPDTRAA